jgi:hypothetical protein
MKQITILITALLLTFYETYSVDFDQKTDLTDYNQYASLLGTDSDFYNTPNDVDVSNTIEESDFENAANINELSDESFQSEEVIDSNEEDSTDDLFDRSAGAMGIGIF